jgi:hypothetical protein
LDIVGGSVVKGQEGLPFLANEHQTIVIVSLIVGGQLNVGDHVVVVLILGE